MAAKVKQAIATATAPAAIGPYSQAVHIGDLLYTSGQIALDPATGQLVEGGIEAQTRQVIENLKAVLEAGGTVSNMWSRRLFSSRPWAISRR
jgi:2-iminobutanoate/2-iminopropanoate deaminase